MIHQAHEFSRKREKNSCFFVNFVEQLVNSIKSKDLRCWAPSSSLFTVYVLLPAIFSRFST